MTNRYYRPIELKKCEDCDGTFAISATDELWPESEKHPICPACRRITKWWADREKQNSQS